MSQKTKEASKLVFLASAIGQAPERRAEFIKNALRDDVSDDFRRRTAAIERLTEEAAPFDYNFQQRLIALSRDFVRDEALVRHDPEEHAENAAKSAVLTALG